MIQKAKILIVGPTQSGKTTLANFLSDARETGSKQYRPTKGCRIVEFEVPNVIVKKIPSKAEVELWDVSGDTKYSYSWPAIMRGANGVVFVYNPGKDDQTRVLDSFHSQFVSQQGLKDAQCIVFCHKKPDSTGNPSKLSSSFSGIPQVDTELSEDGSSRVRQDFIQYLGNILSHMSEIAESHEKALLL